MKLTDLEPQFLRHEAGGINHHVDTLDRATGLFLLCPACFAKNQGPIGTHGLIVTFADHGVPDDLGSHNRKGEPSRWTVTGTGYADLSTQPSIDVGCWHGHITNGDIT